MAIPKPQGFKLLFPIMSDDGQPLLLTAEQIDYIRLMQFLRAKKKEAVAQARHEKLMRKTKRRPIFNQRLN